MYNNPTLSASWICYPDDFEHWLHKEVSMHRDERLTVIPPFFRMDTHYTSVKFRKWVQLQTEEQVTLFADGVYNIAINDRYLYGNPTSFALPAGKHLVIVSVVSDQAVPAIFAEGAGFNSDETWEVSNNNHIWHPASKLPFHSSEDKPSDFKLATQSIFPSFTEQLLLSESSDNSIFLDFGKESFGYIFLHQVCGSGLIQLYYGESKEEALAPSSCETFDELVINHQQPKDVKIDHSRAFRYVQVIYNQTVQIKEISALYEFLPVDYHGKFRCSNEKLNNIWDTSLHTLHLTTREFFLDGIKRDRWVWSGDAYQSFLMNYYSFFNNDVCKRTLIALRGKDPVETHINHILDYSLYWIIALYDYHLYTGDTGFVRRLYPKMLSLLDFCLKRTNESGFMEGLPDDWVFVDWGEMDNKGEVCFEQLLFCRSLEIVSLFAKLFNDEQTAASLLAKANDLKQNIIHTFWDEQTGGLKHSRRDGKLTEQVTRYANMFALSYGYLTKEQADSVISNIMLNNNVQPIVTPYMRFYELASLCELGKHSYVTQEMINYWGGMLELGATSFWETFDPALSGAEHYAMYGRPFGKSLCHSWGASPLYIIGKYYLGVRPLEAGYSSYVIEPALGGLEWIEGTVPTPAGNIAVYASTTTIKVKGATGYGTLRFQSLREPSSSAGSIERKNDNYYELTIKPHMTYHIQYENMKGDA